MVLKWSRGDTVLLPDFAALVNQRTGLGDISLLRP